MKVIAGLVLVVCLGVTSEIVAAQEVYTATLTSTKGLGLKKTAQLTVTIDEYTTEEQAAELQKILEEQGSEALFEAFRKTNRGVAKVTGGPSSIINHVRVHPGENGSRVIIITSSPLYFPEDEPDRTSRNPMGLIELVLNDQGYGRGTLADALEVHVTESGSFQVTASRRASIDLDNVQRER